MELEQLQKLVTDFAHGVDYCSFRYHKESGTHIACRQNILHPLRQWESEGIMVTVHVGGGIGYGATATLTSEGIQAALQQARSWAQASAAYAIFDFSAIPMPTAKGKYTSRVASDWNSTPLSEKLDFVREVSQRLKRSASIVDWSSQLTHIAEKRLLAATSGAATEQNLSFVLPTMRVTAHERGETITRSGDSQSGGGQGGLEILAAADLQGRTDILVDEALALLSAPDCPTATMDVILDPGQMILQIHESIGHPIELDRILGDERNYAGTSFVTLDMFGSFQYGSKLLNVTFDPTVETELATYGFDDEGTPAEHHHLIKDGILLKPLGGNVSQARAGIDGVANSRSMSWNRPPIDRMANLNLEPGESTLDDLIAGVDNGVLMKTNQSWSIDDSRNKFQFGCEYGRRIEKGRLTHVVKSPNYRGISQSFWRSLAGVANESTREVLGTPYCGKGELNQMIRVGHASPTCLFHNVDVFGGH